MDEQKNILSEFAIASLVIGILSFISLGGIEKAVVAIVFGVLALKRMANENKLSGRRLATAGIILGIFSIIATTTFIIKYLPQVRQQIRQMQREGNLFREGEGSGGDQQPEAPKTKLY